MNSVTFIRKLRSIRNYAEAKMQRALSAKQMNRTRMMAGMLTVAEYQQLDKKWNMEIGYITLELKHINRELTIAKLKRAY